jgi:N-acetylglutamate synthase-like GNAT family acetyltransferase
MPAIRRLIRHFPQHLAQTNLPGLPSFVVAEHAGELVGCCALQIYSKRMAEVRSLAVLPEFQDQGIASKLVKRCVQRARDRGIRELFAVTSQTSFFGKLGFTTFRREKIAMFFQV